ncbi:MAG: hypothetical protein D6726_00970 [Nitrospirae bacterium]|nr:MAG: hypothetical protein D6726_00970 [Nitrospirota bacterium]
MFLANHEPGLPCLTNIRGGDGRLIAFYKSHMLLFLALLGGRSLPVLGAKTHAIPRIWCHLVSKWR